MNATRFLFGLLAGLSLAVSAGSPAQANEMFVTSDTGLTPAQTHEAMKRHAEQKKWLYIGDNKLKNGEVTQVRLCIREAAADIWKAGMHLAAMLPCGHFAIYSEDGRTKIAMLHPRFMSRLDSHPIVQKLAEDVTGPFLAMLEELSR